MIQYLIAGLAVAIAALYSAWVFIPASWRRTAAALLARRASDSGLPAATARALQVRLERAPGCGDCDSCRACTPAVPNRVPRRS
jgi:alkylhydroperoxidase family enzyme